MIPGKIRWGSLFLILVSVFLAVFIFMALGKQAQSLKTAGFQTPIEPMVESVADDASPTGMARKFTFTLPAPLPGENTLAFYVVNHSVTLYRDGELYYQVKAPEGKALGRSNGCYWVALPIGAGDAGREYQVILQPAYASFSDWPVAFVMGEGLAIYSGALEQALPQMIMAALAILLGIVFGATALLCLVFRHFDARLAILWVFAMCLGIWKLCDTRFTPFLFAGTDPRLVYNVMLVSLMLAVAAWLFNLRYQFTQRPHPALDRVCLGVLFLDGGMVALQLAGIADLRETLILTHGTIFLAGGATLILVIGDWHLHRKNPQRLVRNGLYLLCLAGVILDIVTFYIVGNSMGILFTLMAFLVYIGVTGILIITSYLNQEKRLRQQERELSNNRIAIMMSQIQPHFLYNSLNTIYHLCGKNSDAARVAINDFSEYLRGNLDSLKQLHPVPFETELRHVRIYLSLEKMRFEDELQVEYDVTAMAFDLPALSVQPLVENAVKYGLGKKIGGGTLTIRTREVQAGYEIQIIDDGVGYNPSQKQHDGRTHIGIENVKSRLWSMCQATLIIDSVLGEGTTARIVIPKEGKGRADENLSC